ncbi:hypothetical protein LY78DRAFT_652194 [Colletotrichum sublineola]|nr:hypothetical protein LY78DRAFT_652194 [Colletotrichum sublineola]
MPIGTLPSSYLRSTRRGVLMMPLGRLSRLTADKSIDGHGGPRLQLTSSPFQRLHASRGSIFPTTQPSNCIINLPRNRGISARPQEYTICKVVRSGVIFRRCLSYSPPCNSMLQYMADGQSPMLKARMSPQTYAVSLRWRRGRCTRMSRLRSVAVSRASSISSQFLSCGRLTTYHDIRPSFGGCGLFWLGIRRVPSTL